MIQLLKNKNILTILISIIIIVILFSSSSFFRILNKTIQSEYYSIKNEIVGLHANPHIVVVEIDDATFESIGRFPFPRGVYAQFIENLQPYSTAVIAFDLFFLDASQSSQDKIFTSAVSKYPNIVLGASIGSSGQVQVPYSGFKKGSYTTGFLPPKVEQSNKTVYSFSPSLEDIKGEKYEHFTLQILRAFYRYLYEDQRISKLGDFTEKEYVFSQDQKIPLSSKGSDEVLINFIPGENFTKVSFSDIYNVERFKQLRKNIDFKDKIILIGPAADGLKDEFFTPNGQEYGVYIHANILNTLMNKEYMIYFDRKLEWLLIFSLVILSVLANLSTSNKVLLLSNFSIVVVFWFIFPISVLLGTNLILNYPSEIILSLLLSFTSANIVKYLIEDINKQKLNKALSEYVGSDIAEEILLEQGKVNLDGQEKNLVCFFSDIEGFTSLSESLTPIELVSFLREYLSQMTSIIMDNKGHIDKFEGDAVMALWGAFTEHSKSDFLRVCEAALLQQKALKGINKRWRTKFIKILQLGWVFTGEVLLSEISEQYEKKWSLRLLETM